MLNFVFALLFAAVPTSQPTTTQPQPGDIVNAFQERPPNEKTTFTTVIYKVPTNRWLIVTDAQVAGGRTPELLLIERYGKTDTKKVEIIGAAAYHSVVGLAFRPGSEVVGTGWWDSVSITGYLASP